MAEQGSRLRIAWVEEWMSTLAREVLPYLARKHEITYVTAGETIPAANFSRLIRGKRWKYMNVAGFELSRRVNTLYRDGLIDIAVVWSSIGQYFGTGSTALSGKEARNHLRDRGGNDPCGQLQSTNSGKALEVYERRGVRIVEAREHSLP